ncbi:hypothetical protein D4764_15G0006730 [Takifugu flavidus]|uniref:Uncharacterized protein n=1 Tax=Takifugu flavidus TaxID=433684 RepID=A0A5C6P304_9TELE|nr:hypothetical protein D4764_15G0006730 [Takifugu flavidus]
MGLLDCLEVREKMVFLDFQEVLEFQDFLVHLDSKVYLVHWADQVILEHQVPQEHQVYQERKVRKEVCHFLEDLETLDQKVTKDILVYLVIQVWAFLVRLGNMVLQALWDRRVMLAQDTQALQGLQEVQVEMEIRDL